MIIEYKENELAENFNFKYYNKNILEIKLKGINNITDMSFMFYRCSSLLYLSDYSK